MLRESGRACSDGLCITTTVTAVYPPKAALQCYVLLYPGPAAGGLTADATFCVCGVPRPCLPVCLCHCGVVLSTVRTLPADGAWKESKAAADNGGGAAPVAATPKKRAPRKKRDADAAAPADGCVEGATSTTPKAKRARGAKAKAGAEGAAKPGEAVATGAGQSGAAGALATGEGPEAAGGADVPGSPTSRAPAQPAGPLPLGTPGGETKVAAHAARVPRMGGVGGGATRRLSEAAPTAAQVELVALGESQGHVVRCM